MKRDLISMEYWREAHLLPLLCPSDVFYVKYARKVRDRIKKADFERKLTLDDMTEIALTLTYYLEDVVSGLGVWHSFVVEHKRMYGRYLPFYDTPEESYYTDEVNEADVRFLIWMIFQKRNKGVIVNPENSYLLQLAHDIFSLLDQDFECVPVNSELLEAMKNPVLYQEFYNLKSLMVQICCMSYLFYYFTAQHRTRVAHFVERIVGEGKSLSVIEYLTESFLGVYEKTGPLAQKPQEWISRMLESWNMKEEAEAVARMDAREIQPYLIVRCDEDKVFLEDWREEHFELSISDMLQVQPEMVARQKVMIGALVKYKGKWYPNGGITWQAQEGRFQKYKEQSVENEQKKRRITEKILHANAGSPLLFFKDYADMKQWLDLNVPDEDLADKTEDQTDVHAQEKNILAFVSSETGLLVLPGGACCVAHKDNPYYQPDEAGEYGLKILFDPDYSVPEVVRYLVQENLLPDAALHSETSSERGKQLLHSNIDFLLRVIRPDF